MQGILNICMQDYREARMKFAAKGEWRKTMEETLHESFNCLRKICHFNEVENVTLLEQSHNLTMRLEDMHHWMQTLNENEKRNNGDGCLVEDSNTL